MSPATPFFGLCEDGQFEPEQSTSRRQQSLAASGSLLIIMLHRMMQHRSWSCSCSACALCHGERILMLCEDGHFAPEQSISPLTASIDKWQPIGMLLTVVMLAIALLISPTLPLLPKRWL